MKAETEIVPMKTEAFMTVSTTVPDYGSGEGDPDPEVRPARAPNDDDDMEYFFEPTTPLSTEEE